MHICISIRISSRISNVEVVKRCAASVRLRIRRGSCEAPSVQGGPQVRIQGLRYGDGGRKYCCHRHHQKSNFLFKKYKKLYKMSNIFYINAKKLNFFVKFPVQFLE